MEMMLGGLWSGKEKVQSDYMGHKMPKEPGGLMEQRSKTLEKPDMKSGGFGVQGTM